MLIQSAGKILFLGTFTVFVLLPCVYGTDIHNALKSKTFQMGRYPKPLHKSLQQQRPYQHIVLFKNSAGRKHAKSTIQKRTFTSVKTYRYTSDPMDWNRRKYLVTPSIDFVKNKKSGIMGKKINHNLTSTNSSTVTKKLNSHKSSINMTKKSENFLKKPELHNHTRKYTALARQKTKDTTGKKKDEIVGKYYYEPINNDIYPFGDKRNYLSNGEKQSKISAIPKQRNKNFLQNKLIHGASDKEIVFTNSQVDETKPVEFFLAENNGEVKIANGHAAQKLLAHHQYNQQLLDYAESLRQKKFREKEKNDYLKEVLGSQLEVDDKDRASVDTPAAQLDVSAHYGEPNVVPNVEPNVLLQPDLEHHVDAVAHENVEEPRLHVENKVPLEDQQRLDEPEARYNNNKQSDDDIAYRQRWAGQDNQGAEQENHEAEPPLSEKMNNFHRLMDKLHRAVLPGRKGEQPEMNHGENAEWQQNPGPFHPGGDRFNQANTHPDFEINQQSEKKGENEQLNLEERERERVAEMERENMNMNEGESGRMEQGNERYPTALKLSKAIINSAKEVDRPNYPGYDISVNGQNLIPEVFEAFSKTNNDLKQRYDALQKWALSTSSQATDNQLKRQIRNLNELSDMVRLVNNLEKDMLKTILKRRKKLDSDELGYKHEIIPDGRDNIKDSHQRFRNPNDVQDLLQYIYDTYIENRTADEIPVVLQAFQKSVTDIVAKKNMTKMNSAVSNNMHNITRDSALISKSIDMLNKESKEGKDNKNTEIPYSLDDDPTGDYDYVDKTSRQGFFQEQGNDATRDHLIGSELNDRKLTKFLDRRKEMNSPLITVKLLKALDLFLDSIEIGRKIKRFRSKVEQASHASNGSVVLTSSMRHSLGELNKEINETLSKSVHFSKGKSKENHIEAEQPRAVGYGPIATVGENCTTTPMGTHHIPCRKSPEDEEEKPKPNFKVSEDYNDRPYNDNGIYFEKHKENGKDIFFEKEWYNNTFNTLNDTSPLSLAKFTPTVNDSIGPVVYLDSPKAPYQHIHDLHEEEQHHDYTQSSWNPGNITKLNKEAQKGQKFYNKSIPYDKLFANDTYHSWNAANMTALNKEAVKGEKFYHDKYVNDSNNFDQEVQKIIDNAISEAKNVSDVDRYYYKHETDTNDHFEKESPVEKNVYNPTVVMNSLDRALDKGDRHVNNALDNNNIDKETVNITNKYLDQEDRYINNMFFEENNASGRSFRNNGSYTQQKTYFHKDINSDKKDQTPVKSALAMKPTHDDKAASVKESEGLIQGDWDKRDMDFREQTNKTRLDDSDVTQIENLRKLVRHLQDQNSGSEKVTTNETTMFNTSVKQGNETTPQVAETKDNDEASTGLRANGAAVGATTGAAVGATTGAAAGETTEDAVSATTGASVGATTGAAVGATTKAAVGATNGAAVGATTGAAIGATTGTAVDEQANKNGMMMQFFTKDHSNDKNNVLQIASENDQLRKKPNTDENTKSEENDYYIKEQVASRAEQTKPSPEEENSDIAKSVETFDKSNFNELEKAITEIKKNKKALSMVHEIGNDDKTGHHTEPEIYKNGDKRDMKATEDYETAHKMIQEINAISYVDDDEEAPAYHRNEVPGKKHSKKTKISRSKKKSKKNKRKVIQKRNVDGISKRNKVAKGFNIMVNSNKYRRRKRHHIHHRYHKTKGGKKKMKISKGTKKNLIEGKNAFKKSFLDKLSKSQQKLVWHILKRAYIKKKDNITNSSQPETIAANAVDPNSKVNKSDESLDAILKKFLSDDNSGSASFQIARNQSNITTGETKSITSGNAPSILNLSPSNIASANEQKENPYATIEEIHHHPSDYTSSHGYPALTNPQGVPIHPHDVPSLQAGHIVPLEDDPLSQRNENFTKQITGSRKLESYEEGSKEQYFFHDGANDMKKDQKEKEKVNLTPSNNVTVGEDESTPVSHNLPTIMDHLDKVAADSGNSTVAMNEQKENNTNELPVEAGESNMVDCRLQNTVITDGDDIFNLPAERCANQETKNQPNTEKSPAESNSRMKNSLNNCTQNFITIKKNGFEYKIPTLKCTKINKTEALSGEVLHVADFLSGNYSAKKPEESGEFIPQSRNTECEPIYKTVVDGETAYKINVGCKKNVEQVFTAARKLENKIVVAKNETKPVNGTVEVIKVTNSAHNEKLIYKGKNLMMTQDEKGSEKIVIKGPNKTIEISYPSEDDVNGFITLKQGNRLYKIPYKNHTEIDAPEALLGKSEVSWLPDYLRSDTNNTETFKVRDTAITKETHINGAKVIKMEKEKASLSIYYPPKNGTTKYNDTGYMVLQENGKTYNIPLDGSKTLKQIANKTHFNSDAFHFQRLKQQQQYQTQNTHEENIPELEYLEHTSPITVTSSNMTFAEPATVKQADVFDDEEGKSNMKLTAGGTSLNDIHLVVPVDAQHFTPLGSDGRPSVTVDHPNKELTNIKERRFREDNFRYRPKAYKADKFRHQKHLIEDDPRIDERNEEEEVSRPSEPLAFAPRLPEIPPFAHLGGEESRHLEVFPTIANRGVDLQEFARAQEDDDERHNSNMHDDDRHEDDSHEDETHEDDKNEEDDDKEFHHEPRHHEEEQFDDGHEGERNEHEGDDEHGHEEDENRDHDEEHGNEDDHREEQRIEENHDDDHGAEEFLRNHEGDEESEKRPADEEREPEDEPFRGDDQRFFPLKESFIGDSEKPVPSLMIPPQLITGGANLQSNSFSPMRGPNGMSNDGSSIFVAGTKTGDQENVRVTPVSSSLNPDINDRERLRDFSTYAIGRTIKSAKKKSQHTHRKSVDPRKMNQFLKQIISDTKSKSTMPDVRQFPYFAKIQHSTLKQLGNTFNNLQKNAIRHYMHANTDKLDKNDKIDLKRLGYNEAELATVNRQVVGKKRSPKGMPNVGIDVNGKKLGNVRLIPHFQ